MKRISKEIFCNGDYETAVAIRIENGEFAFLGDMEEWSDSPDWNIPGRRIFAPYKYLALDRVLVSEGILDAMEAPEYELTPMVYYYETEEECSNKTIYEAFIELVKPYVRNGNSDTDDYDIFVLSRAEFMDLYDAFRDGDYIFIIEDVNVETHTAAGVDYKTLIQKAEKRQLYNLTIYDVGSGLCELIEDNTDSVIIQWVTFTTCYNCQSCCESDFLELQKIPKNLIYEMKKDSCKSIKEIQELRSSWLLMVNQGRE